jgi:DNA-binding MarR family transcriptional regulator
LTLKGGKLNKPHKQGKSTRTNLDIGAIYATFWRMVYMSVHRYDSNSTGELLTVMTIALLRQADYDPTSADLAEITGLPKTSVSRYVSRQMRKGYLTEVVDRQDRRRRRLRATAKGRKDEQWHRKETQDLARLSREALRGLGKSKDPVSDLKKILLAIRGSSTT